MKKFLSITGLLICLFCGNAMAQAPQVSTAANPKWYFIQVVGAGNTQNRVATVVGDKVEGQPIASENISLLNAQLWRVELEAGVGYVFINKSTGKTLSVTYDQTKNQRVAAVSSNASAFWRYAAQGAGYALRLSNETNLEGASGEIYLYQGSATDNYALIFTSQANSTGANGTFNFVINEIPVISTEDEVAWMYIKNAKTGKYLTDVVDTPQDKAYFILDNLKTDGDETYQQWKLIKKANNNMMFVNRETGNSIHTDMTFDLYYYMQFTNDIQAGNGWKFDVVSDGQYAIYTTDANGVIKYWYATTPGQPTEAFDKAYAKNSAYAWTFSWAPENITGIKKPDIADNILVYALDKRIYVEGCDDYKIYTLYGIPVYQNSNLPTGIYLVTVKGRTTKVLVK